MAGEVTVNPRPLFKQITALTTYANGITGASDTRLGDAVRTLAAGYGQGGGVDTSNDTVTADSLKKGVTAHDADGNPVTGTLPHLGAAVGAELTFSSASYFNGAITLALNNSVEFWKNAIANAYVTITNEQATEKLGTAAASDVAEGKTFTSCNGVNITGTAKLSETDVQACKSGTVTLSSDCMGGTSFTIQHGLMVTPDMFIVYAPSNIARTYTVLGAVRCQRFSWNGTT